MALTPVILNPGVGGSQIQTDNIGGDSYEVVKVAFGSEGSATMVDAANPLPVLASIDTTGLATSANQSTEIAALASIAAEDFATQTTLAAVLAKISADPATQTTLAAILAKIISAPSTEAKQDAANTLLTTIAAITQPLTDTQLRATPVPVIEAAPTTIFNGKTTVSTAGTRVTLGSSTTVKSVTIKAALANTGTIYVGNATVSAANGFELAAGDTISLDITNLSTVNIDSSTNSQSVTYLAVN